MGTRQSLPPGQPLYIQKPAWCCSGCHCRFRFNIEAKPAMLETVPSEKWSEFQAEVNENAQELTNHEFITMIFLFPLVMLPFLSTRLVWVTFVGLTPLLIVHNVVACRNHRYDKKIRELCEEFSYDCGVNVRYCTRCTNRFILGFCIKPSPLQTSRVIVVQSGGTTIGVTPTVQPAGHQLDQKSNGSMHNEA
eukprot:gnl/MRDRNA2_/MRDRNA2_18141_c0_seq2.p1 gnl/MRDRNA2_/MRDRNA2_18141_c0~~gnl/MRDRNA2_/MRDRNA2_18141_c0_seq2.p1  ORF type:complete len:192 (-),score=8.82 gnl/MRDRNA2_/MRDRNA2_18141_c0_seq2:67-642(-)